MVGVAITLVLGVVIGFSMTTPLWLIAALVAFVAVAYLFSHSTLLAYLLLFVAGIFIATVNPTPQTKECQFAKHVNQLAADKIGSLSLSADSESLVEAIALGRRDSMSRELVSAYRYCGASHLLAISGLHIGMVALLIGIMFRPLVLLPYGNIFVSLIVVALLWFYSAVVGFTPSVVRSTVMFSVLIINRLTTGSYTPLRSLAIAVVVMVAASPSIIYSISFQLSVAAVLSIIVVAVPIIGWLGDMRKSNIWWRLLNTLLTLFIIGIVCSLATMPIAYHYFGSVCWWGWIISPLLVVISYLIISLSIVWLIVGFGAIAPLFSFAIDLLCQLQNGLLLYCMENV